MRDNSRIVITLKNKLACIVFTKSSMKYSMWTEVEKTIFLDTWLFGCIELGIKSTDLIKSEMSFLFSLFILFYVKERNLWQSFSCFLPSFLTKSCLHKKKRVATLCTYALCWLFVTPRFNLRCADHLDLALCQATARSVCLYLFTQASYKNHYPSLHTSILLTVQLTW